MSLHYQYSADVVRDTHRFICTVHGRMIIGEIMELEEK